MNGKKSMFPELHRQIAETQEAKIGALRLEIARLMKVELVEEHDGTYTEIGGARLKNFRAVNQEEYEASRVALSELMQEVGRELEVLAEAEFALGRTRLRVDSWPVAPASDGDDLEVVRLVETANSRFPRGRNDLVGCEVVKEWPPAPSCSDLHMAHRNEAAAMIAA